MPRRGGIVATVALATLVGWAGIAPVSATTVECSGVRPGAVLVVPVVPPVDPRPYPTFGFLFHGSDGHVYASTAGHVVLGIDGGERVWNDDAGTIAYESTGTRIGVFVYAVNSRASTRPGLPKSADMALIRVDDAVEVAREVCGIGGPIGVDRRVVASPQPVEHRWFGATVVGGRVGHPAPMEGPWLFPERFGVSLGMPDEHAVNVAGHASFGDSGAPVLGDGGLAVGWVSGPPATVGEASAGGTFVVSRISPAIERAEQVLGITLTLATAGVTA